MTLTCEVLDSLEGVEPAVPEWDALAVAAGRPYCAPAWMLSWWRHMAPEEAQLRVLCAREAGRLVGIAPFYTTRQGPASWCYRLLGSELASRIEPLAAPSHQAEVARKFVEALQDLDPRPGLIKLDFVEQDSPWLELLSARWPGGAATVTHEEVVSAPTVALRGAADVDGWLRSRSSNFRQQMRRARRGLEGEGAVFRISADPDELERDLAEFKRLHNARWDWRGGSAAMVPGTDRMLAAAGRELLAQGRFRVASIEVGGAVIDSLLFVAAGREIAYWNGGFDDAWAKFAPSQVGLVEAVRTSLVDGYERLDLGPGDQRYKYRFSDGEDELTRVALLPPGARRLVTRLQLAPQAARRQISQRMSADQKAFIRRWLRIAR